MSAKPSFVEAFPQKRSGDFELKSCLEGLAKLFLCRQPLEPLNDFAPLEDENRRDGADAVLDGRVRGLIDIDLADRKLALAFIGKLINDWGDHATRPAPGSPEINEDRCSTIENFGPEVVVGKFDGGGARHGKPFLMPVEKLETPGSSDGLNRCSRDRSPRRADYKV